jgi:hypothetical protein
LGDTELANYCGVSQSTIWRYKKRIRGSMGIVNQTTEKKTPSKSSKRVRTIPNYMKQEFLNDYTNEPMGYMLAKYSSYGLDTEEKIKKAYFNRTRIRKSYYVKKNQK